MKIETQNEGVKICIEIPSNLTKIITQAKDDIEAAEFTVEVSPAMRLTRINDGETEGHCHERMVKGKNLTNEKIKSIADGKPYSIDVKYTRNFGDHPEANIVIFIHNEELI